MYDIGAEFDIGDDYLVGDELDAESGADDDMSALLAAASGDDYLVGARRRAARGGLRVRPQQAAALARVKLAQQAALVRQPAFNKSREYVIGFDSTTTVAAAAQATITARPQVPFRGERLIVPSDIAGSFVIDDIRVGKNSQLVAAGAIPARTFEQTGVGVRLRLDTCQVSMDLILQVTNISGGALRFRASMIGLAVE